MQVSSNTHKSGYKPMLALTSVFNYFKIVFKTRSWGRYRGRGDIKRLDHHKLSKQANDVQQTFNNIAVL